MSRFNWSRRLFTAAIISSVAAAFAPVAATAQGADKANLSNVVLKIGIASKLSADEQLKLSGQLKDLPYKIEWAYFDAAPPAFEALSAGHIDFFSGGVTPVFALARTPGNAAVVAVSRRGLYDGILVPQNSPIKTVADLKGKSVALYRGSGSQIGLINTLRKAGLEWSDIKPVYISLADALAAFQKGEIDAWDSWDPSAAIAQTAHNARELAENDNVFSLLYASRPLLSDPAKQEAIKDYITRVYKAAAWVRQHPEEWTKHQVQVAGLPEDAAALAARRIGVYYQPVTPEIVDLIQQDANTFAEIGILPAPVDLKPVFDGRFNDFLTGALADLPKEPKD